MAIRAFLIVLMCCGIVHAAEFDADGDGKFDDTYKIDEGNLATGHGIQLQPAEGPFVDGDKTALDNTVRKTGDETIAGAKTFTGTVAVGSAASKSDADIVVPTTTQWLNSADESVYGYEIGYIVVDNTDGTEDTAVVVYRIEAGTEVVAIYAGPSLSAAPATWTPATNCRARSDGTGSSPWNVDQWVRWNGSAWEAD